MFDIDTIPHLTTQQLRDAFPDEVSLILKYGHPVGFFVPIRYAVELDDGTGRGSTSERVTFSASTDEGPKVPKGRGPTRLVR